MIRPVVKLEFFYKRDKQKIFQSYFMMNFTSFTVVLQYAQVKFCDENEFRDARVFQYKSIFHDGMFFTIRISFTIAISFTIVGSFTIEVDFTLDNCIEST